MAVELLTKIEDDMQEPEEEIVEFTPVATEEVQYAEFVPDEEEEELEISLEDTLVVLERKQRMLPNLAIMHWQFRHGRKLSKNMGPHMIHG